MKDNAIFQKALSFVLKAEGGYVNDPDDKGGATNKGITQNTYNGWLQSKGLSVKDVKNITTDEVAQIYYQNYWIKAGCTQMSKVFAVYAFDTAVNMGVGRVKEFMTYAQYKDPNKFLIARIAKYRQFSKNPSQAKFLKGWLNRVNALREFAKTV